MTEINEYQKWPTDKKQFDENWDRVFGSKQETQDGRPNTEQRDIGPKETGGDKHDAKL